MPTPELLPPEQDFGTYPAPEVFVKAAYEAIGRLMVEYAAAEVAIAASVEKFVSERLTGSSSKEARDITAALVGSSRMERVKELAKKLSDRVGIEQPQRDRIALANVQLGHIQKFRNMIAHHGAHPYWYDSRWSIQTSNKYNVTDYSKREMTRYRIEDIEDACFDLNTCWMIVQYALFPRLRHMFDSNSLDTNRHLAEMRFKDGSLIRESIPA